MRTRRRPSVSIHAPSAGRAGPPASPDRQADCGGRLHHAGREDLPTLDVRHLHASVLRSGAARRHAVRSRDLRLPPRRARRTALPEAHRSCLAEPAPCDGLPGAVLRRSRGAASPGATPARRPPRCHSARDPSQVVASATYHQVWWPSFDEAVYDEDHSLSGGTTSGMSTARPASPCPRGKKRWTSSMTIPRRRPCTLRLGRQIDIQGIIADENDADRRVAYLTKYLAKSFGDALGDDQA